MPPGPGQKTSLKLPVAYPAQAPQNRVGAGYPVRQGQMLPQPLLVGFAEKDDVFHAFHPADHGDNAEQQHIHQLMLFAAVDPRARDQSKFGAYVHYAPLSRPYRFFSLFLEGFYNALALTPDAMH
jgi:hypothetical protein